MIYTLEITYDEIIVKHKKFWFYINALTYIFKYDKPTNNIKLTNLFGKDVLKDK